MKDIFYDYMSNRLGDINLNKLKADPGPVITISRAAGCSSQRLSRELAEKLNQLQGKNKWTVISKEVLQQSASELSLHPKKIKSIFKAHDRTVIDDVMQAFLSKDYHLEKKMRKTVINTIKNFAIEGHKIILGRGANIICADIKNSLHVRIDGPLDWRVHRVMKSKNYTKEESLKCILDTEKDRINFRKSIKGKKVESEDFDITINQSKFSNDKICEIIIAALGLNKQ